LINFILYLLIILKISSRLAYFILIAYPLKTVPFHLHLIKLQNKKLKRNFKPNTITEMN